jgi:hypothetical protein
MASTNNSKTKMVHLVLSVLISSTFLLATVLENQNLYALTSDLASGFSHGEQQAPIDFQNNSPFNPLCVEHTSYYCAGYFKGYNVTWNLAANWQTSNPSPKKFDVVVSLLPLYNRYEALLILPISLSANFENPPLFYEIRFWKPLDQKSLFLMGYFLFCA